MMDLFTATLRAKFARLFSRLFIITQIRSFLGSRKFQSEARRFRKVAPDVEFAEDSSEWPCLSVLVLF